MSETAVVATGTQHALGAGVDTPGDEGEHPAYPHVHADGTVHYPPGYLPARRPQGPVGRFFRRLFGPAWIAPVALAMCMTLPVAYVLSNNPTDAQPDFGGCAFKILTGFDCPGCGGTRALWYVLHGNLPEAARYHAVAVFAAPFLVYMYVAWAWNRMFPRMRFRLPRLSLSAGTMSLFLVVWAVYWVARNLPWAPFTSMYV